jgi:hypothetical protein
MLQIDLIQAYLIGFMAFLGLIQGGFTPPQWVSNGKVSSLGYMIKKLDSLLVGIAMSALVIYTVGITEVMWYHLILMALAGLGEQPGVGTFKGWVVRGHFKPSSGGEDSWIPKELVALPEPWNPWVGLSARGFLWGIFYLPLAFTLNPAFVALIPFYMISIPASNALGKVLPKVGIFKSAWTWSELFRHIFVGLMVVNIL